MDKFPLTHTNTNEPSRNKPSSPQPEDFQCDDLSSYNTLPPSEEERPNDYSEFWKDPAIQAEFNELVNIIKPKTSNPDSCTAPTTNMPIAATQQSYHQFPGDRENTMLAPITYEAYPEYLEQYDQANSTLTQQSYHQFPGDRENTMRAPITYEADPKHLEQYDQANSTLTQQSYHQFPGDRENTMRAPITYEADPKHLEQYDQANSTLTQQSYHQFPGDRENTMLAPITYEAYPEYLEQYDQANSTLTQQSYHQFPGNRENTMRAPITYEDNPEYLEQYDYTRNPFPKFTSLLSQLQAPNPDSCTSPKTNMPVAATQPSDNQFPVNRENTMRDLITYKADPKDYIRTCLYALCEPLFMYWKCPTSEHIKISILKIPPYEEFKGNVEQYLHDLCPPPSSSDGQDNLQSTRYKEKWDEFYNGARIAINKVLQSSNTTVKDLQDQGIETETALSHHRTNKIKPIYSKIYKLCELPLSHTKQEALKSLLQQEALKSLFKAVYKHYKTMERSAIKNIVKACKQGHTFNNHPVNNFKDCPEIPELKDLFSLKQQYINGLKQKIENLITYIDQNTDSNNLMVISHNSMINPKYVTMIKDIIIEKIKQNPDYEDYMPLIKLGAKPHKKLTLTPGISLRHAKAHPLVITCQLDADESNTLTKDQQNKVNTCLNAACRQINEQFTATLNRTLSCTSSNQYVSRQNKELKQPESQATMVPMPMQQMPVEPTTPPNIKRQHTSYGLSPSTEPQTPSKKRKQSNTPLSPSTP